MFRVHDDPTESDNRKAVSVHLDFKNEHASRSYESTLVVSQGDMLLLRSIAQRLARGVERVILVTFKLGALLVRQPAELDDLHLSIERYGLRCLAAGKVRLSGQPRGKARMSASTPLRPLVDSLEQAAGLDAPGKAAGKALRGMLSPGALKDTISGTWLGHAVHPPLTDLVVGSLISGSLLDLLGADERAASRLIGVGLLAAGPTALTGANDWADTEVTHDGVRRVGLVHASANLAALTLYALSLAARRRGARDRGRRLSLAGAAAVTASGYLGGHMSYTRGVGPNQTVFDPGPGEWTPATDASELNDGEAKRVIVGDTPVLLVRHGDDVHAIHDRCGHRGCSLADGDVDGKIVTCSCHGSRFELTDGSVVRGPATSGQPVYDAREHSGLIEIRLRAVG
jgi:nitrite reductase/ring-hydroxylating ferredoxin subunit/uncharacterized membrane protein